MRPIHRTSICADSLGQRYKMEISIETSGDLTKYPQGIKAVFRLIRLDVGDEARTEVVILIDNHAPYGFHSHDKLPEKHDFRKPLHIRDYREAWDVFQQKCREVLHET